MRPKEISRRLGVPKEGKELLKKILRKMVRDGKIGRADGGYVAAGSPAAAVADAGRKPEPKHSRPPGGMSPPSITTKPGSSSLSEPSP